VVVTAADLGVGVGTFEVTILDPSGNVVTPSTFSYTNGRYEATVLRPLAHGEYTVKAVATDRLGASCEQALAVRVEAKVLAMTGVSVAPNPYNPQGGDKAHGPMMVAFNLARSGDVTIKIYDFAGVEVATLANQMHFDAGDCVVNWAGEANDHTALANGAYICRIVATDGIKTAEQSVKLVIWRE